MFKYQTKRKYSQVKQIMKLKNDRREYMQQRTLMLQKLTGTFYVRELLNKKPIEFKIEKVIKKIGKKLYVKCKSYDILLND